MKLLQNRRHINTDLAGSCHQQPNYLQIRARMNRLIDRYLSIKILSQKLIDLPTQFAQPHVIPTYLTRVTDVIEVGWRRNQQVRAGGIEQMSICRSSTRDWY